MRLLSIAAKHPMARFGRIELRPVWTWRPWNAPWRRRSADEWSRLTGRLGADHRRLVAGRGLRSRGLRGGFLGGLGARRRA